MSHHAPLPPDRLAGAARKLYDRFVADWETGTPPSLEALVAEAPEAERPALLRAALPIERERRAAAGRPLAVDEALKRFAPLGPWAAEVLDSTFGPLPREPFVVLDVVHGPYAGRSFPLDRHDTFTIGRQPGHAVSLPDDHYLSRAHCLVEVNPPFAQVVDLRSKTGTLVNGQRVARADLRDGDEVRAGLTVFRVRVPAAAGPATLDLGPDPAHTPSFNLGGRPVVPGYALGRELGRGGMGVVYHATALADGAEVAVKTLLPAIPPTRTALGRFVREADILRRLRHPNIVTFREVGSAGPLLYFAMEYVPGTSAAAILTAAGPLPPARVSGWARQLLDALAHAHAQGFVHRDVKPSNLLVVGPPGAETLKLGDFGLARAYEESSMSGLTVANASGGTPAYMPPEQVNDFRNVRPAADQYAAAATLFQLLTGRTVYDRAPSSQEMLLRIMVEDPIPLQPNSPPIPDPFGPVIRRALARDPAARFPDLRAMAAALFDH